MWRVGQRRREARGVCGGRRLSAKLDVDIRKLVEAGGSRIAQPLLPVRRGLHLVGLPRCTERALGNPHPTTLPSSPPITGRIVRTPGIRTTNPGGKQIAVVTIVVRDHRLPARSEKSSRAHRVMGWASRCYVQGFARRTDDDRVSAGATGSVRVTIETCACCWTPRGRRGPCPGDC